jgi:uncharacterized membrane protein
MADPTTILFLTAITAVVPYMLYLLFCGWVIIQMKHTTARAESRLDSNDHMVHLVPVIAPEHNLEGVLFKHLVIFSCPCPANRFAAGAWPGSHPSSQ